MSKTITKSLTICKRDDAKRIVYGVVYEPDLVDGQGDWSSADEIEKACHDFMEEHGLLSVEHGEVSDVMTVVENWIAQEDSVIGTQDVKKGSWCMGIKVKDDDIWKSVKDGELTGFSMEGAGERDFDAPDPVRKSATTEVITASGTVTKEVVKSSSGEPLPNGTPLPEDLNKKKVFTECEIHRDDRGQITRITETRL